MSRPDPIEYAERLYAAIGAANFSTMSFLAFGNAVKDGVALRRIPRIAAEPFMRVIGEMLELEERIEDGEIVDAGAGQIDVQITPLDSSPSGAASVAEQAGSDPAATSRNATSQSLARSE